MTTFTQRLTRWLRRWLGASSDDQLIALTLETAARLSEATVERQGLITDIQTLAEQNAKMAQAFHQIVAQLNANTTTIQRWGKESATLQEIERRHARHTNGSKILTLGQGIGTD